MAADKPDIHALFDEAVARDSDEERSRYLDEACGDDPRIRERVESLLRAHSDAGGFFGGKSPPLQAAQVRSVTEQPGTTIGHYKLLEAIGEGGMGTVWVAEQSQPVRRKVALKLIKPGMDSKSVLARFETERQALAVMDHPNIAKVHDGGLTESGRPFFVMEYIKGVPITDYCEAARLSIPERLQLFVEVCQAVQHAHQKGIVHRDLKPSNILIALYDDKAVPKVIDFGLAKAVYESLTEQTLHTAHGMVLGTPMYMSPEQAQLNNLDVDTRSDIYSLGVLLYELLTGTTPLEKQRFKEVAWDEIRRIIREEEPPRPSTRLSSSEMLPSLAAGRQTEPMRLTKLVRGELDWVAMKALEKDRARRYETANGLARDVQRYLADEPVEACPPSASYRLRKMLRRNKGPVLATALVLLALLAGMAGTTWGLLEARWQRDRAEAKQADAERQKTRAEAGEELAEERLGQVGAGKKKAEEEKQIALSVRDFLQNKLLGQAGPRTQADALLRTGGLTAAATENPTVRELLDRAAKELAPERIEASFPSQPLVQADILQTVGRTYRDVGEYERAIDFLERSAALFRQHLGLDHPDTLISMNNLGLAYMASGKLNLALPLFEETLKLMKANLGPNHPQTLMSMTSLATAYQNAGKLDLALPLFEETLKLSKAKLGLYHPDTLISMNNLAVAYQAAGKLDLALPLDEETLKLMKAKLGPEHPCTLTSMNNLATAYQNAGKQSLALPLFEETLELVKAKLGTEHPDTLTAMNNLASAYKDFGKLDLALPLFEETLKLRKAKLGPDHPDALNSMGSLASAYQAAGKLDLALPLFVETLKLMKVKLGPEHPGTLTSMNNLAGAYKDAGKLDLALPLLEETLKLRKVKLGPEHPDTLTSMNNLALTYQAAGKLDLAIPLGEETLKLMKVKLGPEHLDTLTSMNNLAMAYLAAGKLDLALPLFEETLKLRKAKLGREHPGTLNSMGNLASAYQAAGKLNLALPLLEETLKLRKVKLGHDHPETLNSMSNLASAYQDSGKLDLALPLFEETVKLREAKLGPEHPDTLNSMGSLASAYQAAGKRDLALALLEKAYPVSKKNPRLWRVGASLVDGYERAEKTEQAAALVREVLADARTQLPGESSELAGLLAMVTLPLLQAKAFAEAEPLLRECLAIRAKNEPEDWRTFNTKSMLGGALLGQKKYAEAEPLLRGGYEGMKQREAKIPPEGKVRLIAALERLIQVYEALEKQDEAAKWRKELKARTEATEHVKLKNGV